MSAPYKLLGRYPADAPIAWHDGQLREAGALRHDAARIASALPSGPGEVLVACEDPCAVAAALLAAWHRGLTVALPPNTQPHTLAALRATGALNTILHDGALVGADAIDVRANREPLANFPAVIEVDPQRDLAVLYTSGTTGARAGWRKKAFQLLGEAEQNGVLLAVGEGSRVLATAPPHHIYGLLTGVLIPLLRGAAMICGRPLLPEAVAALAREADATHLVSVPAHLRALAAAGVPLGNLKVIVSSSAPLETELGVKLSVNGVRVIEILGSTETGGIALRSPPERLWTPLPQVKVSAEEDGKMIVESPFLEAGARYTCADVISLERSGHFEHHGRADGVVKIGGRRVALQEVEQALRGLPGVTDAAVASFPSTAARGREIWAMVAAAGQTPISLRDALRKAFDPVVVPRRIRCLDALPREPNGKLPDATWRQVFGEPAREVLVHSREAGAENGQPIMRVAMGVPADLWAFEGHFDEFPILSGVYILNELVVKESQRAFEGLGAATGLSNVKFRKPIGPGTELVLTLRREAESVAFLLTAGAVDCAQGSVLFAPAVGEPRG